MRNTYRVVQIMVFYVLTPCLFRRFSGTNCLHIQGERIWCTWLLKSLGGRNILIVDNVARVLTNHSCESIHIKC
jgi:hypothetical protein